MRERWRFGRSRLCEAVMEAKAVRLARQHYSCIPAELRRDTTQFPHAAPSVTSQYFVRDVA